MSSTASPPYAARSGAAATGAASSASVSTSVRSLNNKTHHQHRSLPQQQLFQEPAIWTTRSVDWPIALHLPGTTFTRLVKASRAAGQHYGIVQRSLAASQPKTAAAAAAGASTSAGEDTKSDVSDANNNGGSYFTGFMSRVLHNANAPHASDGGSGGGSSGPAGTEDWTASVPLRAPRCVAAANGWIVAAAECPYHNSSHHNLRVVSRWNVRRSNVAAGMDWVALPPPVDVDSTNAGSSSNSNTTKIVHVFVDPTGCHTFLSAANGEAYYIHSSQPKQPYKLAGFGRNADGSWPNTLTGIPAGAIKSAKPQPVPLQAQKGLSANSHVTAIAWDKDRGTEGSTKSILLGTSAGEIYEYCLTAPTAAEVYHLTIPPPVLLRKLYSPSAGDPPEVVGAAVSGLYLERVRTGVVVLLCTSGKRKRTRLYTFASTAAAATQQQDWSQVFATDGPHSLQELPGSVEFADLKVTSDLCFGLRTQAGIYYGTLDRSLLSASGGGGTNLIVDSGLLPYEITNRNSSTSSSGAVVSLALTPHHIVTLTEDSKVSFINRVAQKGIQTERLDIADDSSNILSGVGDVGELLMDVRRPDQIWLRKGRSLIHISSSSQEDRDVWKYTLQKCLAMPDDVKAQEGLFEQAKTLCTNAAQKV
jgi:Pep3/Vps18/deep orange family